jgi:hypothetical protein
MTGIRSLFTAATLTLLGGLPAQAESVQSIYSRTFDICLLSAYETGASKWMTKTGYSTNDFCECFTDTMMPDLIRADQLGGRYASSKRYEQLYEPTTRQCVASLSRKALRR